MNVFVIFNGMYGSAWRSRREIGITMISDGKLASGLVKQMKAGIHVADSTY
jgi:hypothetical protein